MSIFSSILGSIGSGAKALGGGVKKGFDALNGMGDDADFGNAKPWQKALGGFAQGFGRAEEQGGGLVLPQLNFASNSSNSSRSKLASTILDDLRTKRQSEIVPTEAGIDPGGITPRSEPLSAPATRPRLAAPESLFHPPMALPPESTPPYVGPYKPERMVEPTADPMADTKITPRPTLSLPSPGMSESEQINSDIAADKFGWGGDPLRSAEYDAKFGKMRREQGLSEDQIKRPTGKQRLMEAILSGITAAASAGQRSGGDIGQMIGAFGAGSAAGAINPAEGRGFRFNVTEKPQLLADEQRAQSQRSLAAMIEADTRKAQREGQRVIDGALVNADGTVVYQSPRKPIAVGAGGLYDPAAGAIIPGTQKPEVPKIDTSTKYARQWNGQTGRFEFIEGKDGQPLLSRQYEELLRREAGQDKRTAATNQTRITTTAMSQAGANSRHGSSTSKAEQKIEREKEQWLNALDTAIKSSNGNKESEAIKNAIQHLQKYPDIETGIGEGDWPYAKRIASAPTAEKVFPAAQLEKYAREHGSTKEDATRFLQGQGYVIK